MAAQPLAVAGNGRPDWSAWDQSPLGMAVVDGSGRLVHVNPSLARWRALPVEALVGRPVAEALPGMTWPLPVRVCELQWPGGPVLAMPGALDDRNGSLLAFCAVDELPRLARTLAEVDAAREELETVIQASFDEIFITDGEGRVVSVNAACERFYGVEAGQLQGKHVTELEEQRVFTPSGTADVIRTGQRRTVVQETRTGRRLVVTSIPVFAADGTLRRVVSVARDVTEVNRLLAQLGETEALVEHYRTELSQLAGKGARRSDAEPVYTSRAMQDVLDLTRRVAPVDAAVLITGESGAGKGHIAALFHRWSPRARGPFQTIDCGALPESLIESELFGYEGGAFTGASKEGRRGLIESADGGTLFLDEVGELPLTLQTKLLRFLQEKTVTRVGGRQARPVDVRVIAATNRDLRAMVAQGRFREDLFWRLNVVPIHMLPLRERLEDVPALLDHFLADTALKFRREVKLSPEARGLLCRYHWPGNVRELENLVVRLVVTAVGSVIRPQDLPPEVAGLPAAVAGAPVSAPAPSEVPPLQVNGLLSLNEAREEVERQLLLLARQRCATTREMADLLGVNQSTIVRKLQKLFPGEIIT